jgi:NADPH-dependent curcumin reductase CurA
MQGFLLPFFPDAIREGLEELHRWVRSGELEVLENVTHGLHRAPEAFCGLMGGSTIGKTLLELDGTDLHHASVATLERQVS